MAEGIRPPAESVRSEEWVNALPYDDPAPTETDLALRTETGLAPGLEATAPRWCGWRSPRVSWPSQDRPSVNLALVVDRSGSRTIRSRLGLVKSWIALLAESLRPDDTVSVVAFDDQVELLLAADAGLRERARSWRRSTTCTRAAAPTWPTGLSLGYEQARSAYRPGGINVVVLCSDGVANVGMTGPDGITASDRRGRAARASTSSPSATGWATTTTT